MTEEMGAPEKQRRASASGPKPPAAGRDFLIGGFLLVVALLPYLYLQNLPEVPTRSETLLGRRFITDSCRSLTGDPQNPLCLSGQASSLVILACVVIAAIGLLLIAKGIFQRPAA